jgi:hypothetical protein
VRERRALRFVVEALFLGALAVALVFADLTPLAIAGVMLLGWLVVALYEWAATRELPHYGRGLPPRYYVPQVSLPPPRQLEQLRTGYPRTDVDDAATWIAPAAMRAEALSDWPVGPLPAPSPGEDTMVVESPLLVGGYEPIREDTWIELEPAAEGRPREVEPEPAVEEAAAFVAEPEPLVELEVAEAPVVEAVVADEVELVDAPVVEPEPVVPEEEVASAASDEVAVSEQELAAEPEASAEPEAAVAVAEPEAVDAPAVEVVAAAEVVPEPEALAEPETSAELEPAVVAAVAAVVVSEPDAPVDPDLEEETEEDVVSEPEPAAPVPERAARHTFDPLGGDGHSRRRWRRRSDEPYVELPARPPRPTVLPGSSKRDQ